MSAHLHPIAEGRDALNIGVSFSARSKAKRPQQSPIATVRGLLLESALLAVSRGMDADALAIRHALIGLGIDQTQLGMAMALTKLQRGEPEACLLLLESEVLEHESGHELALAVQSRIWQLQGLSKGYAQANALLVSSADPAVREMARARI